jgi:hypothetical protein
MAANKKVVDDHIRIINDLSFFYRDGVASAFDTHSMISAFKSWPVDFRFVN